ncbi:MAG: hypothetical protein ABFD07_19445 [Methanobacterium sp.]
MEYNIEKLSDGKRVVTIDGKKCELVGNGFIRQDYPPYVRELLKKHGDKRIIAMKACRTPITISTDLLNIVSLGQFKKNLETKPFDDLFHLDLRIELDATPRKVTADKSKIAKDFNKKVSERRMTMLLEKKHVIKASMNPTEKPNTQFSYIPIHSNELTINKLLEGAKRILGNKFFTYDAYNNNCQDFIMAILNGSRIGTEENRKFIKQDTKDLFDELPVTKKIARLATDTGATLDRIVYGQGSDPCWKGYTQYGMKMKNNRKVPNCIKGKGNRGYGRRNARIAPGVIEDELDEVFTPNSMMGRFQRTRDFLNNLRSGLYNFINRNDTRTPTNELRQLWRFLIDQRDDLLDAISIEGENEDYDIILDNIDNIIRLNRTEYNNIMDNEGFYTPQEIGNVITNIENELEELALRPTQTTTAYLTEMGAPEMEIEYPEEVENVTPVNNVETEIEAEPVGYGIHKSDNYYIQSVVFDKEKFDVKGARKWLKENNYIARKPDVTETQIRFRQVNPKYIEQKGFTKFRTKKIGRKSGISLIISYKK